MTVIMISALTLFACGRQNENRNPKANTAGFSNTETQTLTGPPSATARKQAGKKEDQTVPETDIHTAIMKNEISTVKKYIADQSDLNKKETYGGSTPLIIAALFNRIEIAKLLIGAGAKLNIQNNDGSTALITAAFFCRTEIVQLLLSEQADKEIKNKYGQTAYDAVSAPFKEVKPVYDMIGSALAPMGLKLDYGYIEKTRPAIAAILK